MRNTFIDLFAAVLILGCCFCSSNKKSSYGKNIGFDSLFVSKKEIQLETSDSILISMKPSIKVYKDEIIITNYITEQNIFVFDQSGRFKYKIGAGGRGPGEYLFPKDICYKNGIYAVLDETLRKIIIYDSIGVYKKDINIKISGDKIYIANRNEFVLLAHGHNGENLNGEYLYLLDTLGNVKNSFMERKNENESFFPAMGGGIEIFNNEIYAATSYEGYVYCYSTSGELIGRTKVLPNKYTPPPEHLKNRDGIIKDIDKIVKYFDSWSRTINLCVTKNYVLLNYAQARKDGHENYISIYDHDLNNIYESVVVPFGYIDYTSDDEFIYFLKYKENEDTDDFINPIIKKYEFISYE